MPPKILVVDDDVDSLKLIGLMLQRNGYEVSAANTGHQALVKAESERPTLIILDVMMPDMNGLEVCRRLRANANTKSIPIIMFTAKTLIDDKVAGFEAGADDYLTKPTHPQELASRVKAVLARTASRQVQLQPDRGPAIGVIGVKGGVGTTTIALNITAALLQAGNEPIIADFRLGIGGLGLLIGFPRSQGVARVLTKSVPEITPELIEHELVIHQNGLRALLSSARPKEAHINYSLENAIALINALRIIANPAVFDLGSGYSLMNSRLLQEMDKIIVVMEPTKPAVVMARELLQELGGASDRIYAVMVNRTQSSMQTPWNEVEQTIGQNLRAIVSAAPELAFQAAEAGLPMVQMQPNGMASTQMIKLAEDINHDLK